MVENPVGLNKAVIDPPGAESVNRVVGNFPPANFNLSPHRLVIQFEPGQGIPVTPAGSNFDGFRLKAGEPGVPADLEILWTGTQRSIGAGTNFQTSAGQFLWLGQAPEPDPNVHALVFRPRVYAAGFVLSRVQENMVVLVKVYADAEGKHLLDEYSLLGEADDKKEEPGLEFFIGCNAPVTGVGRIEIIRQGSEGYLNLPLYLDDLAILMSPSGRPMRFKDPAAP